MSNTVKSVGEAREILSQLYDAHRTEEQRLAHQVDTGTAYTLLTGTLCLDRNGLPVLKPLSSDTKPTEREARSALCRVLLSGDVDQAILDALAAAFSPNADEENFGVGTEFCLLKAHLKRRSQGRRDSFRDYYIACQVDALRRQGQSYDTATSSLADQHGLSQHWVKEVYGRAKDELDPAPRCPRRRK
jgi:hypothetical protein